MLFRACVTSVARTHYTFKVMNSLDASYEVMFMGLWTWAEITTGIIISCLPVTPKFFRYAGPKVRHMFPVSTRSRFRAHQPPESVSIKNEPEVYVHIERRPDGRNVGRDHLRTWGTAANGPTGSQGHHIPLSKRDMAASEEAVKNGRESVLADEVFVRVQDLESGT